MMKKGYSKKTISENIGKEMALGHPKDQAVAMAMEAARQSAKKAGKPNKAPKKAAAKKAPAKKAPMKKGKK